MDSKVQWPSWMVQTVRDKGYTEEMSAHCTPRRCGNCINDNHLGTPAMATYWRFTANKQGGKNKSSRRPVCEAHAK